MTFKDLIAEVLFATGWDRDSFDSLIGGLLMTAFVVGCFWAVILGAKWGVELGYFSLY